LFVLGLFDILLNDVATYDEDSDTWELRPEHANDDLESSGADVY